MVNIDPNDSGAILKMGIHFYNKRYCIYILYPICGKTFEGESFVDAHLYCNSRENSCGR